MNSLDNNLKYSNSPKRDTLIGPDHRKISAIYPNANPEPLFRNQPNDHQNEQRLEFSSQEAYPTENSMEKLDFSLKIFVEAFEVSYKLCDDFGLIFRPFIEIALPKDTPTSIHLSQNEGDKGENIMDKSAMSDRSSLNLSNLGSMIEGDSIERTYYYKEVYY